MHLPRSHHGLWGLAWHPSARFSYTTGTILTLAKVWNSNPKGDHGAVQFLSIV